MSKIVYRNLDILLSERDRAILEKMLSDPDHKILADEISQWLETDRNGCISFFLPPSGMKWSLVFFIQNLMIMQRMYRIDSYLEEKFE